MPHRPNPPTVNQLTTRRTRALRPHPEELAGGGLAALERPKSSRLLAPLRIKIGRTQGRSRRASAASFRWCLPELDAGGLAAPYLGGMNPTTQAAVDRLEKSLAAARFLFELYPSPRPRGRPSRKFRPIPPAVVQSVTAGFEAFAEELLVTVLVREGNTWAQIAKTANLTNPTLNTLSEKLAQTAGIAITPKGWSLKTWKLDDSKRTTWWARSGSPTWDEAKRASDSWMQVRHCLTHGLVTGMDPALWPGPVTGVAHSNLAKVPTASEVLVDASGNKKSLTLYPAVNAALIYSHGAAHIATQVAAKLGDTVDVSALTGQFDNV